MKYDAFISYSHAADGKLAPALQNALHKIAKPLFRISALKAFRDETDLSATPHLWEVIENSLTNSDHLILLASPTAAKSKWVKKELVFWLQNKSIDTILIALTEGTIIWNDEKNDFDWENSNAIPEILKGKFRMEPLYADFRSAKTEEDLSLSNPIFKKEAVKLAAPIHKKTIAELVGEDLKEHKKVIQLKNSAIVVLLVLLTGVIGLAWLSNVNAQAEKEQRKRAEKALLESYKNQIEVLTRDREKALGLNELAKRAGRLQDTILYFNEADSLLNEIEIISSKIKSLK
ncbi:MAG: TIR domain-containing protein [Lewinellaceae bacterium]|nr:TIR domain-containing protein [Bacteroidota bacterium]MCB9323907.1 TIR domain-containing protein [Lewinellaceae bacterium]